MDGMAETPFGGLNTHSPMTGGYRGGRGCRIAAPVGMKERVGAP